MVFSSLTFLLYFLPITLIVYFLLSFSISLQNLWLFFVSLVFYAWGEPSYLVILLISIVINYILGLGIGAFQDKNRRLTKVILFVTIVINLGILFVFKYMGFFVGNINAIAGRELIQAPKLALPIGISFFTFQAMSYVIDVYRKDAKVQKNPFYMGLYIALFPQLVAGPIVRYNTIEEYIRNRKFDPDQVCGGFVRFAVGMSKKVLISNNMAILADRIYELASTGAKLYDVPVVMAWTGAVAYMLQIYYDFSAYSDMAIGLGNVFGFKFEENFNYPYISKSIGEFWRRWHISLGTWFKEYVYFPLGGSRVENQDHMVRNTFIVWALTGLWHGASWTFVLWGIFNFVFIMIERLIDFEKPKKLEWLKHVYCLFLVLLGWVFFRAETLYLMKEMFRDMFWANGNSFCNSVAVMMLREYWMVFIPAIIFSTPVVPALKKKFFSSERFSAVTTSKLMYITGVAGLFALSLLSLVRGGYNPFIYFNF